MTREFSITILHNFNSNVNRYIAGLISYTFFHARFPSIYNKTTALWYKLKVLTMISLPKKNKEWIFIVHYLFIMVTMNNI